MPEDEDTPEWWRTNEQLRDELDLPTYEPPRFTDGRYVQKVVSELESRYDCTIRLIGVNASRGGDWEVRVDGTEVAKIGRHRSRDGTTTYEMTAERFRSLVAAHVRDRSG